MDESTKAEWLALRDMTETDGWAVWVRETTARMEALKSAAMSANRIEDLFYLRGQYDVLNGLVRLQDLAEQTLNPPPEFTQDADQEG